MPAFYLYALEKLINSANSFLKQIESIHKLDKLELPDAFPTFWVSRVSFNQVNHTGSKPFKQQQIEYRELIQFVL